MSQKKETPQVVDENYNKDVDAFTTDMNALVEKHNLALIPEAEIRPNGTIGAIIKLVRPEPKKEEVKDETQEEPEVTVEEETPTEEAEEKKEA